MRRSDRIRSRRNNNSVEVSELVNTINNINLSVVIEEEKKMEGNPPPLDIGNAGHHAAAVDPMNQLVAALSNNNRAPVGTMPEYSDVSKSGLPGDFILKIERYARANKWNTVPNSSIEQEMLLAAPLKLNGPAESWYNDLEEDDDAKTSWNGFKTGLVKRFTIPGQDAANFHIYSQRIQKVKSNETVEEYAEALKKLVKNIANKAMVPDCVQVSKFISGLEPMLRLQISGKGILPATFNEAVVQATLMESAYAQYKEARNFNQNNNSGRNNNSKSKYRGDNKKHDEAAATPNSVGNDIDLDDKDADNNQQRPKKNNSDSNWKKKIECYKCHKMGHFANECWSGKSNDEKKDNPVKQERNIQMVRSTPETVPTIKEERQKVKPINSVDEIKKNNEVSIMVGNVRTVAVFDNGADYNCISIDLIKIIETLAGHKKEIVPIVDVNNHEYYAANGHDIKCLGEVVLPVEHVIPITAQHLNKHMSGTTTNHLVRFSVIEGLVSSVLLGSEYINEFVEEWYPRRGILQLVNKQVVAFHHVKLDSLNQLSCCGSIGNVHFPHCTFECKEPSTDDEMKHERDLINDVVWVSKSEVMIAKPKIPVTIPPNSSKDIEVVAVVEPHVNEVLFEPKVRKRGLIARVLVSVGTLAHEDVDVASATLVTRMKKVSFTTNVINNTNDPIHLNIATTIGTMEVPIQVIDMATSSSESANNADKVPREQQTNTILQVSEKSNTITDEAIKNQIDDKLTSLQFEQLFKLIKKYKRVVAENPKAPKFSSVVEHVIDTGDHPPIKQRSYRTAHKVQEQIREQVNEMLENGIIRGSNSPWASPVVLVLKKDGSVRFCTDYRKLNAITRKDSYPLPRINETLDVIGNAKWFSSIDFCSGFWQIPVAEKDIPKTAFITRDGLFEYTRMPFGLCNSPSTFQRTMDLLLTGMNNRCALVYIDDILIFSNTFEQHLIDLEELFKRLVDAEFSIKLTKCHFGQREVNYLGHTINEHGVSPDENKLKVIKDFPYPTNLTELRSFLGMLNYYNQFIEDFAHIAAPLYDLTRKEIKFEMNEQRREAVDKLKQKLLTAPILRHPNFQSPFTIYTDASNVAVGVVLAQQDENGIEYVVAYGSRALSSAERKYTTTERECLAVLYGVKIFRPYIYGIRFTVITDHGSLTWLFKLRDPEGRLGRWSLKLQGMDMKIEHRAGTKHGNVDGLSRVVFANNTVGAIQHIYTFTPSAAIQAVTRSRTRITNNSNTLTTAPSAIVRTNESIDVQPAVAANEEKEIHSPSIGTQPANEVAAFPMSTETKQIRERIRLGQLEDIEMKQLIDYLNMKKLPDDVDPSRASRIRVLSSSHLMIDGLLHHIFQPTNLSSKHEVKQQIVIPKQMRQEIMIMYHDSYVTGHYGVDRTFQRLNERVYWDTMYTDVYNYCRSCIICAKRKTPHRTKQLVAGTLPIAAYPWQRISIDVVGPLPTTIAGNSYIVVINDWFTRWPEAFAIPNQQDETICQLIVEEICCRYGCPEYLHSDRGSNFLSALSTKMYETFDIHKTATTSYHPAGNGLTERSNQTIVELLSLYCNENDWDAYLPYCLSAMRSAINASTLFTPHYLMFGREMRLPTDVLLGIENTNYNVHEKTDYVDEMEYRMKHAHMKAKEHLESIKNKRDEQNASVTSLKEFNIGDLVMMYMPQPPKNTNAKLYSPWRGPYKILERVGDVNYIVDLPDEDGRRPHNNIHAARLKLFVDPTTTVPYIATNRN